MNFLAHAYLSPNQDLVQLGNTFGDFVKGKKMTGVHPQVIQGVLLHRRIDQFTDQHPLVIKAVSMFKPTLGRFSAIAVDVCFDYFLAKNWTKYSDVELTVFVNELFVAYELNRLNLTDRINQIAPVMKMQEWLLKYQTIEGLEEILKQMSNRVKNKVQFESIISYVKENEVQLNVLFHSFFKDLMVAFKQ